MEIEYVDLKFVKLIVGDLKGEYSYHNYVMIGIIIYKHCVTK